MRRDVQAIVLILIGGAVLRITIGDTFLNYVQEPMRPWLLLSGGILVVLGGWMVTGVLAALGAFIVTSCLVRWGQAGMLLCLAALAWTLWRLHPVRIRRHAGTMPSGGK